MKCYETYPKGAKRYTGYIFAETRGKAKKYALDSLHNCGWMNIRFTDIMATREPELDEYFIEEGKVFDYNQVLTGGR